MDHDPEMTIILDSSLLIAFKVKNDFHHERASHIMKEVAMERYGRPMITDYIFDETVTGIFIRSKSLRLAVSYGNELLESLVLLRVDEQLFKKAWQIFSEQRDETTLSFTDTTTIAAVRHFDISKVGTFDLDFQKVPGIDSIA